MAHTFVKWIKGILYVKLVGPSPERFINLCRSKDITIWHISCNEKQYAFCIPPAEYKTLKLVARKTKTIPHIIKKHGFPFFFLRWKQKKGFLAGIIIFFGLLFFMSKLVWNIEIQGQYTHTKEQLLKYLNQEEVHCLIPLAKVNCVKIEESIRKKYPDIGWVSAEIEGTNLIIRIKETNMPSLYEKQSIPVHLVSKREGTVYSIVTRTGHPLVKAGDSVKMEDVLISGIVDIIGDNELLVRKNPCVADGDVILRTEYRYQKEKKLDYVGREYTGKKQYGFAIQIGNKQLIFSLPSITRKGWKNTSTITERTQYLLGSFDTIVRREYINKEKKHTLLEAEDYLKIKFNRYVKKIKEKRVIIEKNNVKIKRIGERLCAEGTLSVLEPATAYRKILDSEWRNTEINEYSRDDN